MTDRTDVLVIGGGIAGVAAALEAAARGARTTLFRAGPGATAMASGGWTGELPDRVSRALADAGLPHTRTSHPIPHASGMLRSFDYATASHAAAEAAMEASRHVATEGAAEAAMEAARQATEDALVCGIAGLSGFHAPALARLWGDAAGTRLPAYTLDLGALTPPAGWSAVALAASLEREPGPLAEALTVAVRETGAARVILPPVLGRRRVDAVRAALEGATGAAVGEALAGLACPSLPGWRLDRALLDSAESAGIDVVQARVVAYELDGRHIRAVVANAGGSGDEPRRFPAHTFVLATGKFTGGGITAGGGFDEPALGCPVWIQHAGAVFERHEPLALTAAARAAPQPLLAAGVHTDGQGRPLDRWGDVVYENVFACGSVRAGGGLGPAGGGLGPAGGGLGAASESGIAAGQRAAEAAVGG